MSKLSFLQKKILILDYKKPWIINEGSTECPWSTWDCICANVFCRSDQWCHWSDPVDQIFVKSTPKNPESGWVVFIHSPCPWVSFLWVLQLPPTFQQHACTVRCIHAFPISVNVSVKCLSVCSAMAEDQSMVYFGSRPMSGCSWTWAT